MGKWGDLLRIFCVSKDPLLGNLSGDLPSSMNFHEKPPLTLDKMEIIHFGWQLYEVTSISTNLKEREKEKLTKLICRNHKVFAWPVNQMPIVDPQLAYHRLDIDLLANLSDNDLDR